MKSKADISGFALFYDAAISLEKLKCGIIASVYKIIYNTMLKHINLTND
ncbi:hypothetical protein [Bacillus sonorensis]|nr:hypothetical protein [Bacillus sonorensis]MCY8603487.1 hypothetical protein [Bacillus sonorensis]